MAITGELITPVAIDVSPATMRHWAQFATGGLGRFLESVINVPATLALAPDELEAKEIAFMRKVVGGIGDRETQETFYHHLTDIDPLSVVAPSPLSARSGPATSSGRSCSATPPARHSRR